MAKIELGKFSDLLRRYLQLRGESDVAAELAPELSAALVLESERPEWAFLKNERLIGSFMEQGAQVAQTSSVTYRNPTNSGILAVFTHLTIGVSATTNVILTTGAATTDNGTVAGTVPRDGRMSPPVGGAIVASFGVSAPAGANAFDVSTLLAFTTWQFFTKSPFILAPGHILTATLAGQNIGIDAGAAWLEKRLDDLERR